MKQSKQSEIKKVAIEILFREILYLYHILTTLFESQKEDLL